MEKLSQYPFILLKYYSPNIPSEDYAVYSKIQLVEVLPFISKLAGDYSNFPKGKQITREIFEQEKLNCTQVRSNNFGEIWEFGDFGNKFKEAKNARRRIFYDNN
jgi:hypothetical protein